LEDQMDWEDVRRKKQMLIDEIAGLLSKEDLNLIEWLLQEERNNRSLPVTAQKLPKEIRDQIDAMVPTEDTQ
jgi:hypothetical protein